MDQMALAPPIDEAGCPLAPELAPSRRRQGTEMRVRQVCEHEHGGHPREWARMMASCPRAAQCTVSRTPDQYPGGKYERTAHEDLKGGRQERRVHKSVAGVGDRDQLDPDYCDRDARRGPEVGNEMGQGMAEPADGGHRPAYDAAHERSPASGERPVVGQRL